MNPASTNPAPAAALIDPKTLMSIRNLELRAQVVVEGFWSGIHRSPFHGFSVEFTEYRPYSPDDDPRYVDWRVFARSDRYFIKKFEDETNLRCYLVCDQSRSMTFGSVGYTKGQYAATLAATLAYFLYLQGDAVGLLSFDEAIRQYLPARHRTGHLRHLMVALEQAGEGRATDLPGALKRAAELSCHRGLMVVISDFLVPLERLELALTELAACGHELLIFQLLDPAELNFAFDTPAMFEDLESGRKLYIEPAFVRREYQHRLEAHCRQLRLACERVGAACYRLDTQRPLELALFDVLRKRAQRRRPVRRTLTPRAPAHRS